MRFFIGVIALALLIPISYGHQNLLSKKSQETRLRIAQIADAVENFHLDCGVYPNSLQGLLQNIDSCPHWGPGPYISDLEVLNDGWGRAIQYEKRKNSYSLTSFGADGTEGGVAEDLDILKSAQQ